MSQSRDSVDDAVAEILPVRMLNEYVCCPRLFHLIHVEGRWEDNVYTVEGKHVHRRVDKLDHVLPDADATAEDVSEIASEPSDDDEPPQVSRSVPLSSERVQLMARGLLLREHGYECDHGVLYYTASRGRVDVPFTTDLSAFERTRSH